MLTTLTEHLPGMVRAMHITFTNQSQNTRVHVEAYAHHILKVRCEHAKGIIDGHFHIRGANIAHATHTSEYC